MLSFSEYIVRVFYDFQPISSSKIIPFRELGFYFFIEDKTNSIPDMNVGTKRETSTKIMTLDKDFFVYIVK